AEQLVESLDDARAKSALRRCVLLGDGGRPRDALADPRAQCGPVLGHPGAEAPPDLERLDDAKALGPAPQTLLRDPHFLGVGELARSLLHRKLQRGGGERTCHGKRVLGDQSVRTRRPFPKQSTVPWCVHRALVEHWYVERYGLESPCIRSEMT